MKTSFSGWHLLALLLVVLPGAALLYYWPQLPAQLPTHFGTDGQANGFTAKESAWWLYGALPLGVYLLLWLLPRLDPKRRLDPDSINYQKLVLVMVGLISALSLYTLYAALHPQARAGRGLGVVLGLFLALIGNYLTTVPPNYFVGFRTPWSLEFPGIWARTHRVGGWLLFGSGLLTAGLALAGLEQVATKVLLAGALGTAAVVYAYSYWLYRQQPVPPAAGAGPGSR